MKPLRYRWKYSVQTTDPEGESSVQTLRSIRKETTNMKNTVKRICAALLVLAMIMCEIPMDTLAKENSAQGDAIEIEASDANDIIIEDEYIEDTVNNLTGAGDVTDDTTAIGEDILTDESETDTVESDAAPKGSIKVNTPTMTTTKLLSVDWTMSGVMPFRDARNHNYFRVFVCKGTTDRVLDDEGIRSLQNAGFTRDRSYWEIRWASEGEGGLSTPNARYCDVNGGFFYGMLEWNGLNGAPEPELKPGDICSLQICVDVEEEEGNTDWRNNFLVSDVVTFKVNETDNPKLTMKSLKFNPEGKTEIIWDMEGLPEESGYHYLAKIGIAKGKYTDGTIYDHGKETGWWQYAFGGNWLELETRKISEPYYPVSESSAFTGYPYYTARYDSLKKKKPDLAVGDDVTLCLRIYRAKDDYNYYDRIGLMNPGLATVYEHNEIFKVTDYHSDPSVILGTPVLTSKLGLKFDCAFTGDIPEDYDFQKFAAPRVYICKGKVSESDMNTVIQNDEGFWGRYVSESSFNKNEPYGLSKYMGYGGEDVYWFGEDEPGLKPGDVCTMVIRVRDWTYPEDNDKWLCSNLVTFQVAGGNVKQPSVRTGLTTYDLSEGAERHTEITLTKQDGSFSFDSLKCDGNTLTNGKEFTYNGVNTIILQKTFLNKLSEGEHKVVLHYTGEVEGVEPVDPEFTITVSESCVASVIVKDKDGNDVSDKCSITWIKGDSNKGSGALVVTAEPEDLTCIVNPGSSLKVNDVQYYGGATFATQTKKGGNKQTVNLTQQGKVQLIVRAEGAELSRDKNGGYSVTWYTKDADLAKKYTSSDPDAEGFYYIGSGSGDKSESPMAPKGVALFYDVNMLGKNATAYRDINKASVSAGYGISTVVADASKGENIVLNVSGNKRSGEPLSPDDYTIRWYRKTADGAYEPLKHGSNNLEGSILYERDTKQGETYYYEIMPVDRENVYNWAEFHGVRLTEATDTDPGTSVVPNGQVQSIDVSLGIVEPVTLKGQILNATSVLSVTDLENLDISLSQSIWDGYTGYASFYDQQWYYNNWDKTVITTQINPDTDSIDFEATVSDLDTMVKIDDKGGSFATTYKSIKEENLSAGTDITLTPAEVPQYLNLRLFRQSPEDNEDGYIRRGSYWNADFYNSLEFTLTNLTKDMVIDRDKYTIDNRNLSFTDMDYARANIAIGDELKLEMKLKDRVVATVDGEEILEDDLGLSIESGSDTMVVQRNSKDDERYRFDLVYSEYGKVAFTTTTNATNSKGDIMESWAVYDTEGMLVESKKKSHNSNKGISQGMKAGKYTLMVWRYGSGYNAASTLEEAFKTIEKSSCQLKEFEVKDGRMTFLNLGSSPKFSLKTIFVWDETGFKDELTEASLDEYKLFVLPYKVDPEVVKENPDATYQFTVKKAHSRYWKDSGFYNVELKCRNNYKYGEAAADKNIVVYDSKGKLADSKVTIDIIDGFHMATVMGFTLETKNPEGKICFYLKCATGGDHPVTASGKMKGDKNPSYNIGDFNLRVGETGALNFTSDYLHSGDNGVWTYSVPSKEVKLYMDDVEIASARSKATGSAFMGFTIDDAFKSKFADVKGWKLAGTHELYTVTDPNGVNVRSAVSALTYVRDDYKPAVLKDIMLKSTSDYENDVFSGRPVYIFQNNGTSGVLESDYWSPSDKGNYYTYEFTATFDDANLIESNRETGEQNYVYMWVIGQDDTEYPVPMNRACKYKVNSKIRFFYSFKNVYN